MLTEDELYKSILSTTLSALRDYKEIANKQKVSFEELYLTVSQRLFNDTDMLNKELFKIALAELGMDDVIEEGHS